MALNVSVDAGADLLQVTAESTVISPLPSPLAFAVLIVTSVPAVRAVTMSPTAAVAVEALAFGVKTPPANVPLVVAAVIDTLAGSSSHVPLLPFGALALILIPGTSSQWPEVSIKPPSPDCAPPRALMLP